MSWTSVNIAPLGCSMEGYIELPLAGNVRDQHLIDEKN